MPKKSGKKASNPKVRRRRTLEFSARYSPRINRRFVRILEGISKRNRIPKDEVLRYGFEAAVLAEASACAKRATARSVLLCRRRESDTRLALDAMVTVRTTQWMADKVKTLWRANRGVMRADVLRGLLERILPIARDKGMAHVMKMREKALNWE
jgi:hypothetical protein